MAVQRLMLRVFKAAAIAGVALTMVCSLLFFFAGLAGPVLAAPLALTPPENIITDTVWRPADSPVIITQTVTVITGTLTISPGVTVKFDNGTQLIIQTGGNLVADGISGQTITFTSNSPSPASCSWGPIRLFSANNIIRHSLIEYGRLGVYAEPYSGGHQDIRANLFRLNGLCLSSPVGAAIAGSPDDSTFNDNTFIDNNAAIYITKASGNRIFNNTISGTGVSAIAFVSGGSTPSAQNQIVSNTIHGSLSKGILLEQGYLNTISHNVIYENGGDGIALVNQDVLMVTENQVYSNAFSLSATPKAGIQVSGGNNVVLRDNLIYANGDPAATTYRAGLYVTGTDSINILGNFVHDNVTGDGLEYDLLNIDTPAIPAINSNAICRQPGFELHNWQATTLVAEGNWWGTNTPTITETSGLVDVDPSIQLSIAPASSVLPADGVSTTVITITMRDSAGHIVPVAARTINLTRSMGTLTPTQVTLNANGIATATLTSTRTAGIAVITATEVCGYAVTTTVEFQAADVAISKAGPGGFVRPGQTVAYTLTFTNLGNIPAANVVITDINPVSGVIDIVPSPSTLNPGDSGSRIYTVATNLSICGRSYLTNTAYIGTTTPEITTTNNVTTSTNSPQIRCLPDLQVTKDDGVPPGNFVWAGGLITYTIRYTNAGYADATNVVLTETLPAYTEFAGRPVGPNGWFRVGATNLYTYRVASPYTGTGVITFVVRVTTTLPAAVTAITNIIDIGGSQEDDIPADNRYVETTPVRSIPDLVVTKTALTPQAYPGALVTYTITLTNQSDTTATNVVLTDTLPLSTTYDSSQPAGSGTNPITWSVGTLPPHESRSFTLTVRAGNEICAPTYPYTYLVNRAEAYGTEPDQDDTTNQFTLNAPPLVCANLAITKELASTAPSLSKDTVFTITYRNIGVYTAYEVVITDFLANNVTYITDTHGGAVTSTNAVTWYLGNIGPNSPVYSFTINLRINVPPAVCNNGFISFTNRVRIDSDPLDNTSNNESVANSGNIPCNNVDLVIVKNDGIGWPSQRQVVYAGEVFTYTISFNNAGGATATGVVITETLPEYTEFVGPTGPRGWLSVPSTRFYVYYPGVISGTLASKEGDKLDFVVRVVPTLPATVTWVYNRIDIGSQQADAVPGDNVSYEQTPVRAIPDLVVTKTPLTPVARPGDYVTYTLNIANQGIGTATNVILTDTLPASTTYHADTSGLSHNGTGSGPIIWNIGNLPPGAPPISFTLTLRAGTDICNVDWLTNTAEARADGPDGNDSNNSATATIPTGCRDVAITKTANLASVSRGQDVVFNLVYSNPGLVTATTVVVTDTLPLSITFVSSAPPPTSVVGQVYTWVFTNINLSPSASGTIVITGHVSTVAPCDAALPNTAGITAAFPGGQHEPNLGDNTDAVTVTVRCIPNVVVFKNDHVGGLPGERPFVQVGDRITYTIAYVNLGNGWANNVVLTETLPYSTSFVGPGSWGHVVSSRTYTYSGLSLPPHGAYAVDFVVNVDDIPPGNFITNTVCAGSPDEDALMFGDNCDFVYTPTQPDNHPRLDVTKSAVPPGGSAVVAGQTLTYTVVVLSDGGSTATNVRITDTLPSAVSLITATPGLTDFVPSLPVGDRVTMTIVVRVNNNAPVGEPFTNTAQAVADTVPVVSDIVTHVVTATVDLVITKTALAVQATPGDLVNYVITVSNQSSFTATHVIVTDTLPLLTSYHSSSISPTMIGTTVVWDLGQLNPGQTQTQPLTLAVQTSLFSCAFQPLTNTVETSAAQREFNPANNVYTTTQPVLRCYDVMISKTANLTQTTPNHEVIFTLTYTNTGIFAANNVVVTDTLPVGINFVSSNPPGFGPVDGAYSWNIGNLPSGATGTGTIVITGQIIAAAGAVLTNTTCITTTSRDDDLSNNCDTASIRIVDGIDLFVIKSDGVGSPTEPPFVLPNEVITYTIAYINLGNRQADGVVITETLPYFTNFLRPSGLQGWFPISGTRYYTYSLGSLNPHEGGVITFAVQVLTPTTTFITNTVCISSAENDVTPGNNCWLESTPVRTDHPRLEIFKNATPPSGATVTSGQQILYTVTVRNNGDATAYNIRITDTLPITYVTFITATLNPAGPVYFISPTLTATVPALAADGWITMTILVTVNNNAPIGVPFTNTAQTIANTLVVQDSLPVMHVVGVTTSLLITKTAEPISGSRVWSGDPITYTLTVRNSGSGLAANIVISDTLDPNVTLAAITTTTGTVSGPNPMRVSGFNLNPGALMTVTLRVTVTGTATGTVITNTASITSAQTPLPQFSQVITHIINSSSLVIAKTAVPTSGSRVKMGDPITYTITLWNNGATPATGVVISDTLSPYVTLAAITTTTGTISGPNPVRVSIPTLNGGQLVTVMLRVTVTGNLSGTIINNQASVTSTQTPTMQPSGLVTHVISNSITPPNFSAFKSAKPPHGAVVSPTNTITYTIVVTNNGGTATNFILTDTISTDTGYVNGSASTTRGSINVSGRTITVNTPVFTTGLTLTVTFRVTVTTEYTTIIRNTAQLSSGQTAISSTNEVTHQVHGTRLAYVYLPIILKNYTPPSASMVWVDQTQDRVREVDGGTLQGFNPDGRNDGAFQLTLNAGSGSRTVATVRLESTQSAAWDTIINAVPVLGIFNGGTRLNNANGTINQTVSGQVVVTLYASDDASYTRFREDTYDYTVYVTFTDGTWASATARIPRIPQVPDCVLSLAEIVVGRNPRGVVVDATRNRIYVANYGSNSVSVVDSSSNTVLQTIPAITSANGIAFDAERNVIWVSNYSVNRVTPIQANNDATTFTVLPSIAVGGGPWGVAVDPVHDYVYVVNNLGHTVSVINANSYSMATTLSGFNQPYHVAANPVTGKAYVTNFGSNTVSVINGTAVIKTINLAVGDPSTQPYGIAVDEIRNVVYVATVNSHRAVVIGTLNGTPDELLGWAAFHRGGGTPNPNRPVPMRAIAVNPDIGPMSPMDDGGHVWMTTSTSDGSELNQAILSPKGWLPGNQVPFHLPIACNVSLNPTEGIAINRALDRAYITSGSSRGLLSVFADPDPPPLIYSLEVDENAITVEAFKVK